MSSFYYCNDCKKPVDIASGTFWENGIPEEITCCSECLKPNIESIIDTPSGEKEKK